MSPSLLPPFKREPHMNKWHYTQSFKSHSSHCGFPRKFKGRTEYSLKESWLPMSLIFQRYGGCIGKGGFIDKQTYKTIFDKDFFSNRRTSKEANSLHNYIFNLTVFYFTYFRSCNGTNLSSKYFYLLYFILDHLMKSNSMNN